MHYPDINEAFVVFSSKLTLEHKQCHTLEIRFTGLMPIYVLVCSVFVFEMSLLSSTVHC